MPIKLDIAEKFLRRFDYEKTTIQVFPTQINGKPQWPRKGGKYLATGEEGSTAIAYEGSLSKQKFVKDLPLLQKQRMGVYFMVNEGDGEHHGKKIVRNSLAVTTLKACFVDTDDGDRKRLDRFCRDHKIKPHAIVQSSPGKYHYYFLIKPEAPNADSTFHWQSIQHRFAAIDPNFDDSMADLGQVLRLPGFYHTKAKPHLVKIVYEDRHQHYDLDHLYEVIGAEATPPRTGKVFERPAETVPPGRRHDLLSAYLGSLSNTIRDPECLIDAGIGFASRHFGDSREWMPSGNRFQELRDQCTYVVSEREKEERTVSLSVLDQKTEECDEFSKLPDEFYLKAPGLVGSIVREIVHYSVQPYPSFAFAAACSVIGTLKAPFVRSSLRNNPPSLYFMCLAESGRGKDFPRDVLSNAFLRLGLSNVLTQKFRSAQGFLKRLSKADGNQLVLHDEAHHLFASMRRSDNDYIRELKPHLLSLFSSANSQVYDAGAVVSAAIEIPPIPYPTVNYCGFGVPRGFNDAFQDMELVEGTLPRFLVLRDMQPVIALTDTKLPKRFEFEQRIAKLAASLRSTYEKKLLDDNPTGRRKFTQIPFTPEASKLINAYSARIAQSRNEAQSPAHDIIQSRLAEQVIRLSVLLSDKETTADIVNFAIQFVDHCHSNMERHIEGFNKGQANKDLDDLLKFVSTRQRTVKGPMLAADFCRFRIRDRNSLENTLRLAIDLGRLQKHERYRREGTTKGRTATAYSVLKIEE